MWLQGSPPWQKYINEKLQLTKCLPGNTYLSPGYTMYVESLATAYCNTSP